MMSTVSHGEIRREYSMMFGTQILSGGVRFRLWAPKSSSVTVKVVELGDFTMEQRRRGWFELVVPEAEAGMHYCFELDDGRTITDPAARYLPDGFEGPAEIIEPLDYVWHDRGFTSHFWDETILYELHIGTFTEEGTFLAAIDRLDHLVALGVNTVEILPVAAFPGDYNWGYDGANLFAVETTYGRPEDFKALIDAAHVRGLAVVLDVVYNHFGPRGNDLDAHTPLTTGKIDTPWGAAINFDEAGADIVRELFLHNARYWLEEFHVDGLRFDAVHEIYDDSDKHFLEDLAEQCRAATSGRHVHLIVENAKNEADWLRRRDNHRPKLFDAQWNDDVHHALHGTITNEHGGYYHDYVERTDLLGRALAEGFSWQGEWMPHMKKNKGEPSAYLPPTAFINVMQNHDQIGNRPNGERIHQMIAPEAHRMWITVYLLSPQIPMLFMGEEWAAGTPFQFFSDIGEEFADSIRESRAKDAEDWPNADLEHLPDPVAESTFIRSKLDWSELDQPGHAEFLELYRTLIALRRSTIVPRLADIEGNAGQYKVIGEKAVHVCWTMGDGTTLELLLNAGPDPVEVKNVDVDKALRVSGSVDKKGLGPWTAVYTLR